MQKKTQTTSKKILAISDLHAGSMVGLTPPAWQVHETTHKTRRNKFASLQSIAWEWYVQELKKIGKVDICFVLGDCIDGQDKKGAGAGQITTDLEEQAEMAIEALRWIKAKKYVFVYGSNYHVASEGIDIENYIASSLGGTIGNHEFVDVNGVVFNLKHKCGRTSIPHGKGTLLHKQKLWEQMWSEYKDFPRSDVLLRGHVHYFYSVQDSKYLMMTCPCLKTLGDRYGGRNFIDVIDYGMITFDVPENGQFIWTAHIANFETQKQKVRKL